MSVPSPPFHTIPEEYKKVISWSMDKEVDIMALISFGMIDYLGFEPKDKVGYAYNVIGDHLKEKLRGFKESFILLFPPASVLDALDDADMYILTSALCELYQESLKQTKGCALLFIRDQATWDKHVPNTHQADAQSSNQTVFGHSDLSMSCKKTTEVFEVLDAMVGRDPKLRNGVLQRMNNVKVILVRAEKGIDGNGITQTVHKAVDVCQVDFGFPYFLNRLTLPPHQAASSSAPPAPAV